MLGFQTLGTYVADDLGIRMHIDASAALGITERRGLSKVRHLDTDVFWLQ